MAWNNKIIWSEGLFLRPQHFQQNDRYFESFIHARCNGIKSYGWGITDISIDDAALSLGKFSINRLTAVLPDGTPVNIPADDSPPPTLDIPDDIQDKIVYLALPHKRSEATEVDDAHNEESLARHAPSVYKVRDSNAGNNELVAIEVGQLRLKLMIEGEGLGQYTCLGIAKIIECRADKKVILDDEYIPPALDCRAVPKLHKFVKEVNGLLHQRGEALAGRVSEAGRGGASEIADFMMLQAVNRYEPLFNHLENSQMLHPEVFYRAAIQLAGELSTFSSKSRRCSDYVSYDHDALSVTFSPVMDDLRSEFSSGLIDVAVPLQLEAHKYGIRVATIADRNLITNSSFVLAVHADIPADELVMRFPQQVKAGPTEMISELVNLQLPGIGIRRLPVAPRQIPYHAGYTYFELDKNSDLWKRMGNTGGFAFHVGGNFPGIELEFWAIKE